MRYDLSNDDMPQLLPARPIAALPRLAALPTDSMIHVQALTKSYADLRRGEFFALRGVDFSAHPGQIFGLLGPNGAGKTTALRILSTALRPTSGPAAVNGYHGPTQPAPVRRHIGVVSP